MFTFLRVVDQIDKEYSTLSENDTLIVCKENHRDLRQFVSSSAEPIFTSTTRATVVADKLPVIYFVTPTYPRREQIAELTRLGQTLMHVRNLFWIVADDSESCSPHLDKLLDNFGKLRLVFRDADHYQLLRQEFLMRTCRRRCLFLIAPTNPSHGVSPIDALLYLGSKTTTSNRVSCILEMTTTPLT